MRKLILLIIIAFFTVVPLANATVICDEYSYGAYDSAAIALLNAAHPSSTGSYSAVGQSFQTRYSGANVTQLKVWASRNAISTTGKYYARIAGHTGTYGTNSVANSTVFATSDAIMITDVSGSYGELTFTFSTPYALVAAQSYTWYIYCDTYNSSGYLRVGMDGTGPISHAGNEFYYAGSNFAASATTDVPFILVGDDGDPVVYNAFSTNYYVSNYTTVTNVTAEITAGDVNVGGVTAEFNNTAVTAGDVIAGDVTAGDVSAGAVTAGDVTASGSVTAEFNNTTVIGDNATFTGTLENATLTLEGGSLGGDSLGPEWLLFALAAISILLMLIPKVPLLNFLVGILDLSIVAATVSDTTIVFHPYLHLFLGVIAVITMLTGGLKMRGGG